MTKLDIHIEADMRIAEIAVRNYEHIADLVEKELQALDSPHPTLGRPAELGPAKVTSVHIKTEHGLALGRFGEK